MNNFRNLGLWSIIIILVMVMYNVFMEKPQTDKYTQLKYSEFWSQIQDGRVKDVEINQDYVRGTLSDGTKFETVTTGDPTLADKLSNKAVDVKVIPLNEDSLIGHIISWLPMVIILAVWIYFMKQMQAGNGKALGFGKSRAKMLTESQTRITFKDVAGIDEAKEELYEIVDFLKDPQKFQRLGGRIPKGALLIGPPGTGKTLLAKAIAGEANVPFFSISGSDFVEMFVGVGASRVRDMFEQAKRNAPCIIFIDEIDAVGRHRGAGLGGGNDEREQTLNQLLVEMDGFEANEGIILIAATNRPDVLDPALLRPGRFDRQITVPNPDIKGREEILNVHVQKVSIASNVNIKSIARGTPGFSGADLANLVNEAALLAARRNKRFVTSEDFEEAKDKVMMGTERRSMAMTEEEKKLTAYHEAGHALVGIYVKGNDPLHKVTIIPRGRALGVTVNLPERDRFSIKKSEMHARLAMMFGGRIAEELIFGEENVTTGASNDIMQATNMAHAMVTVYGMSDKLGPLRYKENQDEVFLGHSVARNQHISDETQRIIDTETRHIIDKAETLARKVLTEHIDDLHKLSLALLEYETMSGEDVDKLLKGEYINRNNDTNTPSASILPTVNKPSDSNEGSGNLQPNPA